MTEEIYKKALEKIVAQLAMYCAGGLWVDMHNVIRQTHKIGTEALDYPNSEEYKIAHGLTHAIKENPIVDGTRILTTHGDIITLHFLERDLFALDYDSGAHRKPVSYSVINSLINAGAFVILEEAR